MAAWSDGYVTDIQYVGQFYPELAPGALAYACLRQSVRPPALGAGSAYLELGCGQGFGLNLLAAANPGMQFWGVDFNPAHIANANRQAAETGLTNVTFEDLSFAQMLALPDGRLPRFDVIALHGVYSWVSSENRAVIVQIIDRLLKPGGLVYVSYNSLPGRAAFAALQRFVQGHAARASGDPGAQVVEALKAALRMQEGGAQFFESAPALKARIEEALKRPPEYLAHEYLNTSAEPLFHADVARDMEGARLSYVGSTRPGEDLIHLAAPAPLQPMIREVEEAAWRETLLDYANNKLFRRDVFVRGRNSLSPREREALLDTTPFTLLVPADQVSFSTTVPIGVLNGDPKIYRPIVEALADGPKSFGDLVRLPALAGARDGAVLQALSMMVGDRQIHPLAPTAGVGTAQAFNRALLTRMDLDEIPSHLAATGPGTAVPLKLEEMVAVSAILRGEGDTLATARHGWELMARTNRRLVRKDGVILQDQTAHEAELAARIDRFKASKLPLLRGLGVL
jgi:SAM-dependent methyltransferase